MEKRNTGLSFLVILALALVLPATSDVTSSYVTLTRDGYQNVVVSIEENSGFASCQEGLDTVKEMIRNTSKSFAQALERPAYFGNVTIIFPDSWAANPLCSPLLTSTNVSDLPWARRHRADIRITPDHLVFGWQPHSFQYGLCQQSGLPINVPSSFLTSDTVLAKGTRMAREWAHYRYGVFDEGGMPSDQRHPSGYLTYQTESSDKILRPNTCSDLKTPAGSWSSENCQSTSIADSTCEFVADVYNPDIRSSLMYRPDLDHMEKFCTKENHDDSLPSKLSYHCGRLSASEVIYKHSDFNPVVTPANTSADITFNVIQNPFSGYHVVLDMASFKDAKSFETARSSLMQFISFLLDPIWLSVDVYNGYNVIELQPPMVLDRFIKNELLVKIASLEYVGSSTDKFGDALSRAQSRAYSGQDVIILTAVQTFSSLSTWVKSYDDNKVNAHLVHFGVSTTKVDIAQLTRYGSSNFVPNIINNRAMSAYSWAVNILQSIYGKTRTHRAKIFEQSVVHDSSSDLNKTGTFYLDSPASRLLVSLYSLDADNDAVYVRSFTLIQPNGLRNDTMDVAISFDDFYTFTLESALEPLPQGLWRFEIIFVKSTSSLPDKRLDIWAESANSSQIQLRTWNSALDNQPLDFTKAPVGLYAQLTQDNKPIRGANVSAFVYVSDSTGSTSSLLAEIPLMDEGISDVTSGDGIYSGIMTKPSNSSFSYSVYYRAYGVNSLAEVDNGVYSRQPTTGSVIPMSDPVPAAIQFNRFEYGPSFQLTSVSTNGVDLIPPQRITDLTILSYDSSSRTAILGWTASKDNYGTSDFVTYYRLERSIDTRETVTTDYPSLAIVDGTVNLTVQVPSVNEGEYVKYRVQGRDSSLNYGEVSNVVSLAGPAPSTGGLSTAGLWAIIGTFIALVVIILVIVLIRCCCPVEAKRRKRQMRNLFSSNDSATRRAEDTPVPIFLSPSAPTFQQLQSSENIRLPD
ncbi:calcium-activated chloride channel regulator 4A-like [Daphnia pulex]|uniref:calcium-activated chloride channel regulator 4A-like n=1 Tax=Daphnia pulex TaxID=6669 RepID=UPI001EDE208E|nr:calcium-activated chloride channel regulator 4A-like [Daphnia pulex]